MRAEEARPPSASGGPSPGAASSAVLDRTICAFWLGRRCFGLDVALVGEVVLVEDYAPVPVSHASVLGLFNLRGAPVALVALTDVVGPEDVVVEERKGITALIART